MRKISITLFVLSLLVWVFLGNKNIEETQEQGNDEITKITTDDNDFSDSSVISKINDYEIEDFEAAVQKANYWSEVSMHYRGVDPVKILDLEEGVKSSIKKDSLYIGDVLEINSIPMYFPIPYEWNLAWELIKFKDPESPETYLDWNESQPAESNIKYFVFGSDLEKFYSSMNDVDTAFIGDISPKFLEMIYDDCIINKRAFDWPNAVIYSDYSSEQSSEILKKINMFTKLCCKSGAYIRIIYSDNKFQDFIYSVE